jgi:hypothetical protein
MHTNRLCSICAATVNPAPPLLFRLADESDTQTHERRMTRTRTLDGGIAIADSGFVDADRTLELVREDVDLDDVSGILALSAANGAVSVSVDGRCYAGLIRRVRIVNNRASLSVAVTERLDG